MPIGELSFIGICIKEDIMELIRKGKDVLTMKYPASSKGSLWREGLASGNGTIGVNMYGGTKQETAVINHAELWSGHSSSSLPDVSGIIYEIRKAIDDDEFEKADKMLPNALKEKGYTSERSYPLPLAELNLTFLNQSDFSDYLRAVNMETGEISTQYKEGDAWIKQDLFVSRADDLIVMRIQSEKPILNVVLSFDLRSDCSNNSSEFEYIKLHRHSAANGNMLEYCSENEDGLLFGAVSSAECNGQISTDENTISLFSASDVLIKMKVFVNGESDIDTLKQELRSANGSYDYYLDRHAVLHQRLYKSAELNLSNEYEKSNEELLLEAYGHDSPPELIEKLWRYGRYLHISGGGTLPFTMYGLWNGEYHSIWSHNMANENIQMIYWHTNVGNLSELNEPLFNYYNSGIDCFRENAKKLYGCRGIFIPAGTTPKDMFPCQLVPVILSWTGAAGWLAQHYYEHWLYTDDEEYLRSMLLPFMKAAADFYEDFIVYDENGQVKLYPSVSPENTPQNFIKDKNTPHPMTTTVNSTIDLAIIKELFTNLTNLSESISVYRDKVKTWRTIAAAIPEYRINEDGAIKEWHDDYLKDRYSHRHLSHIYPVFPGWEICSDDIMEGFERAVDMRDMGAQTGWSLAHMACAYTRFGRGNDAAKCLDKLVWSCMQNNFFSLHNDWRRMDTSLEMERDAPVQLDALMGYVNAVQKMILYSSAREIILLPALPDNMLCGSIRKWRFIGGEIDMDWDINNNYFKAELRMFRNTLLQISLPKLFENYNLYVNDNIFEVEYDHVCIHAGKNDKISIFI